jgi:hypothetical protein
VKEANPSDDATPWLHHSVFKVKLKVMCYWRNLARYTSTAERYGPQLRTSAAKLVNQQDGRIFLKQARRQSRKQQSRHSKNRSLSDQRVAKKQMPAERRSPWHANCNDVGIQTIGQFNEHCGFWGCTPRLTFVHPSNK